MKTTAQAHALPHKHPLALALLGALCIARAEAGVDPDDALLDDSTAAAEIHVTGDPDTVASGARIVEDRSNDKVSVKALDLYASDKAARLRLMLGRTATSTKGSWSSVGFLFNEERDNLVTGTLVMDATPDRWESLYLGVGLRGFGALLSLENNDVFGVGAGIEAGFDVDLEDLPVFANAAVYYAPDIFTFGQSDRIIDMQYDIGVTVRPSLDVYVGGRYLQFDTRPGERKLDQQVHIGFRWRFED